MTAISTYARSMAQSQQIKLMQMQFSDLQTQLNTGKKTQLLSGLGSDAIVSKRARADFNELQTYIDNIDKSQTRIKMMLKAVEGIKAQATAVADGVINQVQEGEISELGALRDLAEKSYDFILDLMNTRDGNTYLFAGSDSGSQPITDAGTLDTYFATLNAEWAAGTLTVNPPNTNIAEEYISRYTNIPETTMGINGSLVDAKKVMVRADTTVEVDYTVMANQQGFKDILTAVSALRNLGDLEDAPGATYEEQQENFYAVFNNIATQLTSALDKMDEYGTKLSLAEVRINEAKADHKTDQNTLTATIERIENAPIEEVSVKITALATQLNATYQVTAMASQLSLVNFI